MGLRDRITRWLSSRPRAVSERLPREVPRDADEVVARLRGVVAELSDQQLSAGEVDPEASLLEEAVLDSVSGAQLLVFIEKNYGVVIEEVELAGALASLADVARRVMAGVRPAAD